jgi:hypothetical protein
MAREIAEVALQLSNRDGHHSSTGQNISCTTMVLDLLSDEHFLNSFLVELIKKQQ